MSFVSRCSALMQTFWRTAAMSQPVILRAMRSRRRILSIVHPAGMTSMCKTFAWLGLHKAAETRGDRIVMQRHALCTFVHG